MYLPQNTGGDFTPPPPGTHLAICYRVIDLGTQQVEWKGQHKEQRKIMLSWELPDEHMEDGQPFSVHQRYTFSSSEKAVLRAHLEAWRGVPFKDSDFGPGGFDIRNILGKPCLLTIVHEHKNGKTYANIKAVAKPMKNTVVPKLTNATVFLSLAEFDAGVYEGLSQGLKDIIAKSPEFQALGSPGAIPPPNGPESYGNDLDDEIPF